MALADGVIIWFDDVMCRTVHRRQHVAQLVEHSQIIQRRIASNIVQVAQIGRTCHGDKHSVPPTKIHVLVRVSSMIGET